MVTVVVGHFTDHPTLEQLIWATAIDRLEEKDWLATDTTYQERHE